MKIYKPIDYLYYIIGKSYEFLNLENSIHPSLAGMISAIQIFSALMIVDYFFDILHQNKIVKYIIVFGGFAFFIIVNLVRYNEYSYQKLKKTWNSETIAIKSVSRIILILYFSLTVFCATQITA